MKRDREPDGTSATSAASTSAGKGEMWADQPQADTGMDELFAVLGYKVKSSDMPHVAWNLQQLDVKMGAAEEYGVSLLSSDTIHYNPSDLLGSVESLLSGFDMIPGESSSSLNLVNFSNCNQAEHQIGENFIYDDDLRAIPGGAIFSDSNKNSDNDSAAVNSKRMKFSPGSDQLTTTAARPVVLVDSQETGIRLVHTLMGCAEAVQQEDMTQAEALVKNIRILTVSQTGAMRKVATYFAEGLARRVYKISAAETKEPSYSDVLQMHFYETAPYLKFAHFTANQAILEAFAGASRVHVIDFSLKQGMQWPVLMQALAQRTEGPPAFRLTGIGPPQPDNTDALHQVGWKLTEMAQTIGVQFEFRGLVVNSLADLNAEMLEIRGNDETVAVNSVMELHRLLARPATIDKILSSIKAMNPKIVTIVEQEANHNGDVFLDRFNEALYYYSTMFDSLESSSQAADGVDLARTEEYLGRQICNVVACEGVDRVERHETLAQWRLRMRSGGFDPVHLGSNAFKQASMQLAYYAGGYRVEENDGCLMLGWHTRPLIATSAWRIASE